VADRFWIDGLPGAEIPADDRGLALADGVFETLRIENGAVSCSWLHRQRMISGLVCLGFSDASHIVEHAFASAVKWIISLPDASRDGVLRLTITRGSGPRGYAPVATAPRIIARFSEGLPQNLTPAVMEVATITWPDQPALAGHKLLARIEQVLAGVEVQHRGVNDVVMTDIRGHWLSSHIGNLFLRSQSTLLTPPLDRAGIAGTRRRAVIEHWAAVHGFDVDICTIDEARIKAADEMFITNSVIGIRSVERVGDVCFNSTAAADALRDDIHRDYPSRRVLP